MKTKLGKLYRKYLLEGKEEIFLNKINEKLKIPYNMILDYINEIEKDCIYEGLTFSKDVTFTYNKLRQLFPEYKIDKSLKEKSIIKLSLNTKNIPSKFISIINNVGWFHSYSQIWFKDKTTPNINTSDLTDIKDENVSFYIHFFEPKYDTESFENVDYLYHLTPSFYRNKIFSIGLSLRTHSKSVYYPPRIYLFKKYDLDLFKNIAKKLNKYVNPKTKSQFPGYDYMILKINNKNLKLRLFQDTNLDEGVYTLENIHPSNISIHGYIDIN